MTQDMLVDKEDMVKVHQEKVQVHRKDVWKEKAWETVELFINLEEAKGRTQHMFSAGKVVFKEATGQGGECKAESNLTEGSGGLRSIPGGSTVVTRENCQQLNEILLKTPFKHQLCENQEDGSKLSHQVPAGVG